MRKPLLLMVLFSPVVIAAEQTSAAMPDVIAMGPQTNLIEALRIPDAATAHIYIYRPPQHTSWGDAAILRLDGKKIVRIGNGKRVSLRLDPGKHILDLNDKLSALALDATPDQRYYIRIDGRLGGCCAFQGKLRRMDIQQGTREYNMQRPVEEKNKMTKSLFDPAVPVNK
jgi:hypothetical protein